MNFFFRKVNTNKKQGVRLAFFDRFPKKYIIRKAINDKIYSEIEIILANGYTVYVNGSKVNIDDFCIADYPSDSYYINNDRKEIYIMD